MATQRDKKKELALELYLHTGKTQKEICEVVGWTEITFSRNKEKFRWAELKAAHSITRENLVRNLLMQADQITENARTEKRVLTSKETDQIVKLATSIEKLGRGESLANYIQVFESFTRWLMSANAKLAKDLIEYQDAYINIKVQELT